MADPRCRVYKYPLRISSAPQTLNLPRGAKVVHVHSQEVGGEARACLWLEVNTTAPAVHRTFAVYATGEDIDVQYQARHVGTVHVDWTVWHVYELPLFGKSAQDAL